MHAYYALLDAMSPYQIVTLTLDGGSFTTTAGDALAVLDELAPGEYFHAAVTPC